VLLNMLGRTHRDWDAARRFVEAGIAVLPSISGRAPARSAAAAELIMRVARARRGARRAWVPGEVNPSRIGMAGILNVAALAAGTMPGWVPRALSVSLDYRGLKLSRRSECAPGPAAGREQRDHALRPRRAVRGRGPQLRVMSAGHGTVMLAREPDLATALVDWFIRTLL
jgi:hypothetical protein